MIKRQTYICVFVLALLVLLSTMSVSASKMRVLKCQKEIQEWNQMEQKWETVDVILDYDMISEQYRLFDKIEYISYQSPDARTIITRYFYAKN